MRIFNENKTQELIDVDLEKGYLKKEKLFIRHHEAVNEIPEQFHYENEHVYENGGIDLKRVIDAPKVEAKEAYDEYEDIQVYIPYSSSELLEIEKEKLREWRERYFKIIDCAVWYDCLNSLEKEEVKTFRNKLLDITQTMMKPTVPNCVQLRVK